MAETSSAPAHSEDMSRHTYATTVYLSNDVPIETLSKMLGDRSIRTTQIYTKITAEKVSRDM